MGISRRGFTLLLSCGLASPRLLAKQHTKQPASLFASAAQRATGQYELVVVDQHGGVQMSHPLPARAHHIAAHPHQSVLAAVGRRPATFIDVVDYHAQQLVTRIKSAPGQHFYGHAIYTNDGQYLITTENEIQSGNGLIVIRDCRQNYRVIRQFSSHGIGPHELKMMPDGRTLVVANGGILTHPDQGRKKLNIESMQPSLAYIDIHSGELLEQAHMPKEYHQLSIRHFDISPTGNIVIALQYQGTKSDDVPLVAFHSQGQALNFVRAPDAVNAAMKQYCGSARFDSSGEIAAISSPRGNLVTFWHAKQNTFLTSIISRDGCGLANTKQAGEFLISTGRGHCYRFNALTNHKQKIKLRLSSQLAWDNHLADL